MYLIANFLAAAASSAAGTSKKICNKTEEIRKNFEVLFQILRVSLKLWSLREMCIFLGVV